MTALLIAAAALIALIAYSAWGIKRIRTPTKAFRI